ncbi:flavodoxin family protein [Candidatus Omnitrophota bacterium]
MKILVVYYSLSGNTRLIANTIAVATNAAMLAISSPNDHIDINSYDLIFIGVPVWAFGPARPMRNFLEKVRIAEKRIALFCSYTFMQGNVFSVMKQLLGKNDILGECLFREPLRYKSKTQIKKAQEWARTIICKR